MRENLSKVILKLENQVTPSALRKRDAKELEKMRDEELNTANSELKFLQEQYESQ